MEKVVYILGAGCSVEDGAPLIYNFFDIAFNEVMTNIDSEFKQKFENVEKFREEELPKSNVEELLSYIDLEKSLKTREHIFDLDNIRNDLIYLIAKTIQVRMGRKESKGYSDFKENHMYSPNKPPTIISFNWDIALDNEITKHVGSSQLDLKLGIDYGTDFKRLNESGEILRKHEGNYKLYKLHGSMNWLYCKKCKEKYFFYGEKIIIPVLEEVQNKDKTFCPSCKIKLSPIIVPPTFKKMEENGVLSSLKEVWESSFNSLKEADRIVIVGYSFPEDDVHFKLFFRSALFANHKKNNKPIYIDIINYKKYLNEKNEFETHYKKMIDIPEAEIRPEFKYEKFSEFANSN